MFSETYPPPHRRLTDSLEILYNTGYSDNSRHSGVKEPMNIMVTYDEINTILSRKLMVVLYSIRPFLGLPAK